MIHFYEIAIALFDTYIGILLIWFGMWYQQRYGTVKLPATMLLDGTIYYQRALRQARLEGYNLAKILFSCPSNCIGKTLKRNAKGRLERRAS